MSLALDQIMSRDNVIIEHLLAPKLMIPDERATTGIERIHVTVATSAASSAVRGTGIGYIHIGTACAGIDHAIADL